jgi:UV DNA damage endonuclease
MKRLGYACINLSIRGNFQTCRLRDIELGGTSIAKAKFIHNLKRVQSILDWNIKNDIFVYRISSDLLPFGSHPILDNWDWWNDTSIRLQILKVRKLVLDNKIRLTIHPGQYNVLNSSDRGIRKRTVRNLLFDERLVRYLGGNDMILHVGAGAGYKKIKKDVFVEEFNNLPSSLREILRIENDDKVYTVEDVLEVCERTGAKIMYDFHHDLCNPSISKEETLAGIRRTWGDTLPKVHLSSGRLFKTDLPHANHITLDTWNEFEEMFDNFDVDVMLETKMKDLSVLKLRTDVRM